MEKPINPKINRAELAKLVVVLNKAGTVIHKCKGIITGQIFKQLMYEEAETEAEETPYASIPCSCKCPISGESFNTVWNHRYVSYRCSYLEDNDTCNHPLNNPLKDPDCKSCGHDLDGCYDYYREFFKCRCGTEYYIYIHEEN